MLEIFLELDKSSVTLPEQDKNIIGILVDTNVQSNYDTYVIQGEVVSLNDVNIGNRLHIANPDDMQSILDAEIPSYLKYLFVSTEEWQIIPFENLIAKYRKAGVKIIGKLQDESEIELFPKILEVGIDGFFVSVSDYELFKEKLKFQTIDETLELDEYEVTHVEPTGNGDRVCVDTFSLLKEGEGMLIGSTSHLFALVEAEVHETGFVRARPFRVNSGVVSLYTLNNQKTNYLSELKAGSSVTVVDREGRMRTELVARIKIERRPMVLVRIKNNDREYPLVLQNAETVRLVTKSGSIPITSLKPGDKVLCFATTGARHFGHSVEEFVEER